MNYFNNDNMDAGRQYAQMMLDDEFTVDQIDDAVDRVSIDGNAVDGQYFLQLVVDQVDILEDAD